MIDILYQDDALIAVNKPANLAVHRSTFVGPADAFLIDLLREQVGGNVYLAHRLDRATSGVLLVARSKEVAAALGEQFMQRTVHKQYLVVVRGWPEPAEGVIDYPLPGSRETGPRREARTRYRRLATIECRSHSAATRSNATHCCWRSLRAAASARSASTWRTSITR